MGVSFCFLIDETKIMKILKIYKEMYQKIFKKYKNNINYE